MQTLILLCTLAAVAGIPCGYYIAWAFNEAGAWLDAYLDGVGVPWIAGGAR